MPDFNPDREGHVNHRFIVQPAYPKIDTADSINTSRGALKFDKENRFMVKDEALAREIQSEYSRSMTVTRVRYPDVADRGHRYHFGQLPPMPWHKYDSEGRRIEEVDDGSDNTQRSDEHIVTGE